MAAAPRPTCRCGSAPRACPPTRCQPAKGRATRRGLTRVRLGAARTRCCAAPASPRSAQARVDVVRAGSGRISAVLTRAGQGHAVVSTAPRPHGRRRRPRRQAVRAARRRAPSRSAAGLRVRKLGGGRRAVLRVRGGKVRWVGVTTAARRGAILREARRRPAADDSVEDGAGAVRGRVRVGRALAAVPEPVVEHARRRRPARRASSSQACTAQARSSRSISRAGRRAPRRRRPSRRARRVARARRRGAARAGRGCRRRSSGGRRRRSPRRPPAARSLAAICARL